MVWDVTADLERFEEAIDWFLARTIIPASERRRIAARARPRAFWIAGVSQLSVVQDVFDEAGRALAKGVPFHDFKRQVRAQLRAAWGRDDPHRIETIFRNAVQSSYNAGRFRQMREPTIARHRPFWMYDAILDQRTTDICRPLDRTVLPAEHAFWDTHVPPLHHRCRSSIRSLRASQAAEKGVTPVAPPVQPERGFGTAPTDTLEVPTELRPRPTSDPALVAQVERTAAERIDPQPDPFSLDPSFSTYGQPHTAQRLSGVTRELFGQTLGPDDIRRLIGVEAELPDVSHRYTIGGSSSMFTVAISSRDSRGSAAIGNREYYRDAQGRLTVHHALLVLEDHVKGKGRGKRILQSQFREYQRLGVERVVIEAAWDGQYVWPRMGFRLRDPGDLDVIKGSFKAWLVREGFTEKRAARIAAKAGDIHSLALLRYGKRDLGKEYLSRGALPLIKLEVTLKPDDPDFARVREYLGL